MNDTISIIESVVKHQLMAFKTAELGVVTQVYSHESASNNNRACA